MIYKGYIIKTHPSYPGMLLVSTEGKGGKIPNILAGMFTDHGTVKSRIDQYLSIKGS